MIPHFDVAVIGGGIVGLAHARMAVRRGLRVVLFERSTSAQGASVRNFGMIWPIGQPAGEFHNVALRSRAAWLELSALGVVNADECGSVHLAHHPDELAVLEELRDQATHNASLLTAKESLERAPLANPNGLLGGLWSASELRVDPRTACARIAAWLSESHGVECLFETPVSHVEDHEIRAADGRKWRAERVVVCSGTDLQALYPDEMRQTGLQPCKLQMLMSARQPTHADGAPHVAGGLTLRHYASFRDCPSLPSLKARIAEESPELDRYGIHVMASQRRNGEVVLGDSHEYGDDVSPFDKTEIDELILRELHKLIQLEDWTIAQRWHGIYVKHPTLPVVERDAADGTHLFVGTGGAGMTMAFALAERAWQRWTGASE